MSSENKSLGAGVCARWGALVADRRALEETNGNEARTAVVSPLANGRRRRKCKQTKKSEKRPLFFSPISDYPTHFRLTA